MSYSAIVVDRLSKIYRRGQESRAHGGSRSISAHLKRVADLVRARRGNEFRALDDVTFKVDRGDIFGIVGRNGAGKSTLLKILARITLPSSGRAEIYGRVSSLLEVGTGFHPELTGRENVFLSGSILGMRKADIARRFDEIVAFSELEKFIDSPVKHYSSGMYVRLAFSVAAHLEPDVLLADEVLAVGDINFETKSIKKMRALNAQGMTILLVTHNMYLIQSVCKRAICIDGGRIVADGDPMSVVSKYRTLNLNPRNKLEETGPNSRLARIVSLFSETREVSPDSPLTVFTQAQVREPRIVRFRLSIHAQDNLHYFSVFSEPIRPVNGNVAGEVTIPRIMLMPGNYYLWSQLCADDDDRTILAEDFVPLLVRGRAEHLHKLNFLWNEAHWRIPSDGRTLTHQVPPHNGSPSGAAPLDRPAALVTLGEPASPGPARTDPAQD